MATATGLFAVITTILSIRTKRIEKEAKKIELDSHDRDTLAASEAKFRADLLNEIQLLRIRIEALEQSNLALRKELFQAEGKIRDLEDILATKFDKLEMVKSFCSEIPSPAWFKVLDEHNKLRVVYINRKFSEIWGISEEYYCGKTDQEVWGKEVGDQYLVADTKVMTHKRGIRFTEEVPNDPFDPNSTKRTWLVWKFPIIDNDQVIGVGGISVNMVE